MKPNTGQVTERHNLQPNILPLPGQFCGNAIHGRINRAGNEVQAIERNGKLLRVVKDRPRNDIGSAFWCQGKYRSVFDVKLEDGTKLTIYRDLTQGGWYELTAAEIAPLADEIAIWAKKIRAWEIDHDARIATDAAAEKA